MALSCPPTGPSTTCNITQIPNSAAQAAGVRWQYDNWRITNCAPVQSQYLINSLGEIRIDAQTIVKGLDKGDTSNAYKTFFKTNDTLPYIKGIFDQIWNGTMADSTGSNGAMSQKPPELICVNSNDWTSSYYTQCSQKGTNGISQLHQNYIVLCPTFWNNLYPGQQAPYPSKGCPELVDGKLPSVTNMTADKDSALLHELSHLYTKDLQLLPPVEGLSECAALSAEDASHNAASYTYFAKSIVNNCTLPNP